MTDILFETPYGTRDFLPDEASAKREIENQISKLFSSYGYEEVVTPTTEYLETLTMSGGRSIESNLFKMFDRNNRTLALHHEMTTPILRLAASRLKSYPMPLKLSYNASVFRFRQNQPGRQCEFYQSGVELLGASGVFADAEILALAAQSLRATGLKDFKICLGHVKFASGLMERGNISPDVHAKIKSALERHDVVELSRIIDVTDLPERCAKILKKLPELQGGPEMLTNLKNEIDNPESLAALKNLEEIYNLLEVYGVAEKISFDLGLIRDFEYYTGVVFEAYAPGVGYSLAGGGRYDNAFFGAECPATGFAIGIERVLAALKISGLAKDFRRHDVYIGYSGGKEHDAIILAAKLRAEGKIVETALTAGSKIESEKSCREKSFDEFIYLED